MRTRLFAFITVSLILSICATSVFNVHASPESPTREELESQLNEIEALIKDYEKQLSTTKTQKKSLTQAIAKLKIQQDQLKLQIKSTTILITDLEKKITITKSQVEEAKKKITTLKKETAAVLRLMNQKEEALVIEMLTSPGGFSDYYNDVHDYATLSDSLKKIMRATKETRDTLTAQEDALADKQEDARNLLAVKSLQQTELGGKLTQQATLLKDTQGKEAEYQQILSDSKKRAAEIRNRIYELLGGGKQISFGEAVNLADWVSKQTGVRTAFILAVLTQESNLGKNVGTCNRVGDPPEKGWRVVMKPTRDHEPFLTITSELGRDPDTTPVSCPMKNKDGSQLGWGGAMGPAQFIPSTWIGWRKKITAITGKSVADPWDNRDAFLAAALKLKADGADGTTNGEWKAAMRYFSGSTNVKYRFYGDNVVKLTEKYLEDIAELR